MDIMTRHLVYCWNSVFIPFHHDAQHFIPLWHVLRLKSQILSWLVINPMNIFVSKSAEHMFVHFYMQYYTVHTCLSPTCLIFYLQPIRHTTLSLEHILVMIRVSSLYTCYVCLLHMLIKRMNCMGDWCFKSPFKIMS